MNKNEKIILSFSKRYQSRKIYPAAVILANHGSETNIDKSGHVPNNLSPQLKVKLGVLGILGKRSKFGNFIGSCAEIRASNKILNNNPTLSTNRIIFSNAYRPRTMQIVPKCQNCQRTF